MRQYQPIWEAIKLYPNAETTLTAPTKNHKRIIQAVRKEKSKDMGWRLLESEKGYKYVLNYKVLGKKLTFTLEQQPLDAMAGL